MKSVFLYFQLAIFLSIICANLIYSQRLYESNIDNSGNVRANPSSKTVSFENNFNNQSIVLFWESADGMRSSMGEIAQNSKRNIITTIGHSFFASTDAKGDHRVKPHQFTIQHTESVYTFGPRLHPLVKLLGVQSTSAIAKFRSFIPTPIDIWFEDGKDGIPQGSLDFGREYSVNAYEGHVFYFTEKGRKDQEIARYTVKKDEVMFVIEDPQRPATPEMFQHRADELRFGAEYLNLTGLHWRHYYGPEGPRLPPVLHMWGAEEVGQIHKVVSEHGFWNCDGLPTDCQSPTPLSLSLEVVSTKPKAFIISDFISEFEIQSIMTHAKPKVLPSAVGTESSGRRNSDTRTSRNTWIKRDTNKLTETISRRVADVLNVSETMLWSHENCEDMQVVHYVNGQKYDPHHDWSVAGFPESRFITLLLYLTDMADPQAGGETSFPKGANGLGFKVQPKKGTAVLFYNLLEDGNGDDLALHAALPVIRGEKWLANFWVWDPKRR